MTEPFTTDVTFHQGTGREFTCEGSFPTLPHAIAHVEHLNKWAKEIW